MKAREFEMAFHTPWSLAGLFRASGFQPVDMHYYHLQLLPHPADRLIPRATGLVVKLTDSLLSLPPLRVLAEGLLAVGMKPKP